ncbi:MAG TPA: N-formylglutamate amidohydrolase, partial [Devosia sp.]|nr:N-formylglutamate amidohydrolase [Devosia sp.]
RVARNRPYAGGFVTRSYGRPEYGVHALQIEISRHLYMNEATRVAHSGLEKIKNVANRLTRALMELDTRALGEQSVAAE